ncbi:hypothetical protein ABK040_006324 [Willaertia magna]
MYNNNITMKTKSSPILLIFFFILYFTTFYFNNNKFINIFVNCQTTSPTTLSLTETVSLTNVGGTATSTVPLLVTEIKNGTDPISIPNTNYRLMVDISGQLINPIFQNENKYYAVLSSSTVNVPKGENTVNVYFVNEQNVRVTEITFSPITVFYFNLNANLNLGNNVDPIVIKRTNLRQISISTTYEDTIPTNYRDNLVCKLSDTTLSTSARVNQNGMTVACVFPVIEEKLEMPLTLGYKYNSSLTMDISKKVETLISVLDIRAITFGKEAATTTTTNIDVIDKSFLQSTNFTYNNVFITKTLPATLLKSIFMQVSATGKTSKLSDVEKVDGTAAPFQLTLNIPKLDTSVSYLEYTLSLVYRNKLNTNVDLSNDIKILFINFNQMSSLVSTLFVNGTFQVNFQLQYELPTNALSSIICKALHPTRSEIVTNGILNLGNQQYGCQFPLSKTSNILIDEKSTLQLFLKTNNLQKPLADPLAIPSPTILPKITLQIEQPNPLAGLTTNSLNSAQQIIYGFLTAASTDVNYLSLFTILTDGLVIDIGGKKTPLLLDTNNRFKFLIENNEEGLKNIQIMGKFYSTDTNYLSLSEQSIPIYYFNNNLKINYNGADGFFLTSAVSGTIRNDIVIIYEKEILDTFYKNLRCKIIVPNKNNQLLQTSVSANDKKTVNCKDFPNIEQEGKIVLSIEFNSTYQLDISPSLDFNVIKSKTLKSLQTFKLLKLQEIQKLTMDPLTFTIDSALKDALKSGSKMRMISDSGSTSTTDKAIEIQSNTNVIVKDIPIISTPNYFKYLFSLIYQLNNDKPPLTISNNFTITFFRETTFSKLQAVFNKDQSLTAHFTLTDPLQNVIDTKKIYCKFNFDNQFIILSNYSTNDNEFTCLMPSNGVKSGGSIQIQFLNELNAYDNITGISNLPTPTLPTLSFYISPNISIFNRNNNLLVGELTCEDNTLLDKFSNTLQIEMNDNRSPPLQSTLNGKTIYQVPLISNTTGWKSFKVFGKFAPTDPQYSLLSKNDVRIYFFDFNERLVVYNNFTVIDNVVRVNGSTSSGNSGSTINLDVEYLNGDLEFPMSSLDVNKFYCKILDKKYSIQFTNQKFTKFNCIGVPLQELEGNVTFGYQFNQTYFLDLSQPIPLQFIIKRILSAYGQPNLLNLLMIRDDFSFDLTIDKLLSPIYFPQTFLSLQNNLDNIPRMATPIYLFDNNSNILNVTLPNTNYLNFLKYNLRLMYQPINNNNLQPQLISNELTFTILKYNSISSWNFSSTDDTTGVLVFTLKNFNYNVSNMDIINNLFCKFIDNGNIKYSNPTYNFLTNQFTCQLTNTNFGNEKKNVLLIVDQSSSPASLKAHVDNSVTNQLQAKNEILLTDMFEIYPFTCFNILSNNVKVCNGNGKCMGNNNCQCKVNYFSNDCSVTKCFDTFSNQSNVCSNSGKCTSYNTCECQQYVQGIECNEGFLFVNNEKLIASTNRNLILNNLNNRISIYDNDMIISNCKDLFIEYNLLGTNARCFFYKGNDLFISLGNNFNEIYRNESIYLKKGIVISNYLSLYNDKKLFKSFIIRSDTNITIPTIDLDFPSQINQQSPLIISSYTMKRNLPKTNLQYNWTSSDPLFNEYLQKFNQPMIKITSDIISKGGNKKKRNILIKKDISLKIIDKLFNIENTATLNFDILPNTQPIPSLILYNNKQVNCYNLVNCIIEISTSPWKGTLLNYNYLNNQTNEDKPITALNDKKLFRISSLVTTKDIMNYDRFNLKFTVTARMNDNYKINRDFYVTIFKQPCQIHLVNILSNIYIGYPLNLTAIEYNPNELQITDLQSTSNLIWNCNYENGTSCNSLFNNQGIIFNDLGKYYITAVDTAFQISKTMTVNVVKNQLSIATMKLISLVPDTIGFGQQLLIFIVIENNFNDNTNYKWRIWKYDISSISKTSNELSASDASSILEIQYQSKSNVITLLRSERLQSGFNYLIRLEGYINYDLAPEQQQVIYIEKDIKIQSEPAIYQCDISPKEGIAFETDFTIYCNVDDTYLSKIDFHLLNSNKTNPILLSSTRKYQFFTKLPYLLNSENNYLEIVMYDIWNGNKTLYIPVTVYHPINKYNIKIQDWNSYFNRYVSQVFNFESSLDGLSLDSNMVYYSLLSLLDYPENYKILNIISINGWNDLISIILERLVNLFDSSLDCEEILTKSVLLTIDKIIKLQINIFNLNTLTTIGSKIYPLYSLLMDKCLQGISKSIFLKFDNNVTSLLSNFIQFLFQLNIELKYDNNSIFVLLEKYSNSISNYSIYNLLYSSLITSRQLLPFYENYNTNNISFIWTRVLPSEIENTNMIKINENITVNLPPKKLLNLFDARTTPVKFSLFEIRSFLLKNNYTDSTLLSDIIFFKISFKGNDMRMVKSDTMSIVFKMITRELNSNNVFCKGRTNQIWDDKDVRTSVMKIENGIYNINCTFQTSLVIDDSLQLAIFNTGTPNTSTIDNILLIIIIVSVVGGCCIILCCFIFTIIIGCCCWKRKSLLNSTSSSSSSPTTISKEGKELHHNGNHHHPSTSSEIDQLSSIVIAGKDDLDEFTNISTNTAPHLNNLTMMGKQGKQVTAIDHEINDNLPLLNGQYEILKQLKELSNNQIIYYKAKDFQNNRTVIIKKIIYNSVDELNQSTTKEEILEINHENICPIYEIFLETKLVKALCIVRPYYKNGNLQKIINYHLEMKLPMQENIIYQIFKQLIRVLEYLHFVIHVNQNQNLTPENILIEQLKDDKIKVVLGEIQNHLKDYIQFEMNDFISPELYEMITTLNDEIITNSSFNNSFKTIDNYSLPQLSSPSFMGTSTANSTKNNNYLSSFVDLNSPTLEKKTLTVDTFYSSDIFALGCILYQCMSLDLETNICQLHLNNQFNEIALRENLQVNYNSEMIDIVMSMIGKEKRPTARQILLRLGNLDHRFMN